MLVKCLLFEFNIFIMKDMKEKIIEFRKKGLTVNQISKELGCSKSTVSYHINKVGLGGNRPIFISDISKDTIDRIKLYKSELKTYNEILSLINISKDKLIKICKIYKLNDPTKNKQVKHLDTKKVIEFYCLVNSLRKTSEHFKVSRNTVRKCIPNEIIEKNKSSKVKITKSESVIKWRKRIKKKLIDYKGGKCQNCGYNKCDRALEFHHLNPKEKDFSISGKSYSFEKMKIEVDKCVLLCSNCHSEIHEGVTTYNL